MPGVVVHTFLRSAVKAVPQHRGRTGLIYLVKGLFSWRGAYLPDI